MGGDRGGGDEFDKASFVSAIKNILLMVYKENLLEKIYRMNNRGLIFPSVQEIIRLLFKMHNKWLCNEAKILYLKMR